MRSRLLRPKSMPLNTLVNARDGSSRVVLSEPSGSYAEVSLFGGQVVSWKNERREQLLYMSTKAQMKPPKAIRGGLPICFPQFGNFGALERHGFARNRFWSFDNDPSPLPPANQQSTVDLVLKSTEDDLKIWPHSFELRVRITISPGKLTIIPRVRNTDPKAFSFMFALRNYLYVSDISEVRVEGLETLDYLDNLVRRERFTEQADAITFDGEIDRVYLNTPTKIAIIDHERKRTIELRKEGMPNAVVWNPWDKKAKSIADMGDEDYTTMLCVDSGAIETPILLKPCEEWRGRQELSIVSSSYCSGQLDPRKVLTPWPGLPKGVKFELTDEEVIEHLEAKCGIDGSKPNPFIQDFICSVDDINYTHPENLPGVNKDGTSAFFFNKTVLAYPKGERKRRLITPSVLTDASVRWRKTGKTKPVMVNGVHKGCKKFMVLYKSAKKGLKPEKSKWVMHQYHLGREEAETGEYVVSKIMYQRQQQQGLENTPEASSSLVEKNLNYWDFNMSYGNCMVSDLEDADLGSLPDICSFASEDSLMNCLEWI
ncbi:hypothetical protein YC2023_026904 [Brassica napus]